MPDRITIDIEGYRRTTREGPCFICQIVAGNPDYRHHIAYQDDAALVFQNKFPTLYGYLLVVPRDHREQVTGDFTEDEYLKLQRLVYHVSRALSRLVPTERKYILSLGSQQANRHVHWHVAPLPTGVPYEDQQLDALDLRRGVVSMSDEEMTSLAVRLRAALNPSDDETATRT